jgi:coproporphyrinogen III oxidase-like Fe-S oxidoreductase
MFQAGASLLSASGYGKNLFNHWANGRDTNVYFTFPTRAEDCLAIGTIADGVFGDYHYRHPRYADYLSLAQSGLPGLEGGLRRTPFESKVQPLVSSLLSGRLSGALEAALYTPEGMLLLPQWLKHGLIERNSDGGLQLTNSGSWFAGNLIAELTGQGPRSVYSKI